MDITITDTDGTPSDHDLAHYLAPRSSSSTNPLSWREADTSFQFGQLFNAPSSFETLTLPWSGEATGTYPVPDHPTVDRHGGDLNLAVSNQSYSTGTLSDSGSRHSSNSYANASATIANNAELGFVGAGAQWQNVSAVYGIHDHETHLPPLRLPDHDRSSLYIPALHPSTHYLPPSSLLPPQMPYDTPASAFSSHSHFHTPSQYHALPPTFLPSRESFSDHNFLAPSGLSTPSVHSSPEEPPRYISMDQLTGPYTINPTNSTGMASATGSSFARRGRGRGAGRGSASSTRGGPGGGRRRGRGAGRGGRRMAPAARPDSPVVPAPSPVASSSRIKRRRPSYTSSPSSTHNTSSSGASGQVNVDSLDPSMKRTRHANNGRGTAEASSTKVPTSSDDEAEYGDDRDDDIYMPSRSASEEPGSDSGHSDPSTPKSLLKRKGKDKMPVMSAAEALAQTAARYPNNNYADNTMVADGVVDQTEVGSSGEWRPLPLRASGATSGTSSSSASKGRRNGTISLPVPVPHLTKKSRGRKVPYVDARAAKGGSRLMDEEDDSDSGESVARGASSGRRGRAGRGGGFGTGGRSFVCQVAGCGKCFVRGEHLKRHVRSIHTNEKPYPCPYEGCNKSFSRRDNLGQHVRLHLMGSG